LNELTSIAAPVLVTGAGGLIGSAICRELAARGIATRAFLAPEEPTTNLLGLCGVEILRGDVRDATAIYEAAKGCGSLVHCAALNSLWRKDPKEFYSVNVEGTEIACRAAMASGIARFVFTSSCEVTGPALPGAPADERRPLDPSRVHGHYERSKFFSEQTVRRHVVNGLPAVILRPTAVMGPGDIHCTPPCMLIRAFVERRIPAYYDAGINIVDVRDVATAHVTALTDGERGGTYILGGHNLLLSKLFAKLSRLTGVKAPRLTVGYWTAYAMTAVRCVKSAALGVDPGVTISGLRTVRYPWFFDSSKAQRELGFEARPLEETIRDSTAPAGKSTACQSAR